MARLNAPRREKPRLGFVLLILTLAAICAGLGTWQVMRLEQKQAEIARIAERAERPPQPLPRVAEWVGFDPDIWDYRSVALTGTFRHDETILVFTSLGEPRGSQSGPGYWVVAPLVLSDGGVVWVNRGFVPERLKSVFADGGAAESGAVAVTGILRRPEAANAFTPGTDRVDRVEWIRDPARFAAISDPALMPVLPAYIDADAHAEGGLPQGGETKFALPNRHFEYALTWYGLAAMALVMLGVWLFARRKG
ncbi:MAG: SURF1 family protein [Alphaproteobacteria bacterium]|nr:SURF1 family protein [Alphaproteobacteria bacterium]